MNLRPRASENIVFKKLGLLAHFLPSHRMTKILMLLILKALQMKNQNFWQSIKRDLLLCRHMVLKDWSLKYLKDLQNLSSKM